jgi:hypothetical protein
MDYILTVQDICTATTSWATFHICGMSELHVLTDSHSIKVEKSSQLPCGTGHHNLVVF